MLLVFSAAAQGTLTVSGTVLDESNEPVTGVSVVVKGTTKGVVTNESGGYTIEAPANGVLRFSFVGMADKEESVNGRGRIDVQMGVSANNLNEVVVIGYGAVRKRDLTGSVSSVRGKDLAAIPVSSAAEAITGRMAGVQVTTTDGAPDAEIMIRVRGGGSITSDNSPLYIVDGFPVASFSHIPVGDIEDITVLKDASSTAIYGAQGANGVILITTKGARAGKTQVTYNGFWQTKSLSKRMEVLDPYEYVKLQYEWAALGGASDLNSFREKFGQFEDMDLYKYQKGTDWQGDMFGNDVLSQQHNVSVSGGTDKTRLLVSGTYNMDGGLMPYSDYSRINFNARLNHEIAENLLFSFNTRTTDTRINGEGSSGGTNKVRTFDGVSRGPVVGLQGLVDVNELSNIMSEEDLEQWQRDNMSYAKRLFQNWRQRDERLFAYDASLDWKIIEGLTYRIEGGYTYGFNENKRYRGETTTEAAENGGLPLVTWEKQNTNRWRVLNMLTYEFTLADVHKVNIMAGQEATSSGNNRNSMTVTRFSKDLSPEKIFANIGLGSGEGGSRSSSVAEPNNMASFFGRLGYSFNERYLATFTLRADGSSRFAPGHQWGYFPSAALAWRIVEESFMEGTKSWLSDLKLRGSYGEAGNNRIDAREFALIYGISTSGNYSLNDVQTPHYSGGNRLANPDIKWESMVTRNFGLDFGLLNQRVWGTVEYYHNSSKDLLLDLRVTAPGYTTMRQNMGQTTNKGVEITLNGGVVRNSNFSIDANFNISFNKSNVDALDSDDNYFSFSTGWASTDLRGLNEYEVRVGQPLGIIYGWETDGYYTTSDFERYDTEAGRYILKDGVPTSSLANGRVGGTSPRPGAIKFKDIDGDGVVDDNDRVKIGDANPKFQGGFGFNGRVYKDFDFVVNFAFVYGNDIYNANKAIMTQQYRTNWPNMLSSMSSDNRYTYLADDGTIVTDLETLAAMNEGANAKELWSPFSFGNSNAAVHSWLIEDGSFLRLQNVTLGYTLPNKLSSRAKIERLRLYCTLNNLYVWTKYSGFDPEVSSPGRNDTQKQLIPGLDYSGYPKSFSWTLGLNVTF